MKARLVSLTLLTFSSTVALGQFVSLGTRGISRAESQPFSADEVHVTDRFLADGNHIHQETRGKVFGDSEGRQRRERELGLPGGNITHMVTIFDPVRRAFIHLDEEKKTATVHYYFPDPSTVRKNLVNTPPVHREVAPNTSRIESKTEDLGTQVIEGVNTHGMRITRTIPAGLEGNDQPITIELETWRADDLQVVVLRKNTDPRSGTTEERLTNIEQVEPDPALFKIPADYAVKENHPQ